MKEYNNDGRLKVYLAGPFFNEEQEERITFLEDILEMYDYDIFSPRKASRITPNCTSQDMIDTFNGNVSHIDDADFVLAVADGNDTGTMFECGYAYAIKKPVLYFNETREKGPNLMLAMSGALPFITKTTNITDIMNINTDIKVDNPRKVLEFVLEYMQLNGLEVSLENTKNVFDEVE